MINKIIVISLWVLCNTATSHLTYAQTIPSLYPKKVDLGISGVFLSFRKSSEDALGTKINFQVKEGKKSKLACLNKNGDQILELVRHEGAEQNSFQELSVMYVGSLIPIPSSCRLDLDEFISFRKIKLGSSVNELTEILGSDYQVESKHDTFVITYSIESNYSSDFLKYYNEQRYYGRYTFKVGKLVNFVFGFDGRY